MKNLIGIPDEEFIRGSVPMTKEEVRIITLAKAKIMPEDIVLDIGAGTGSLSIEAARMAEKGMVYAIERKKDAVALIKQNMQRFGTANITVIEGEAPEALQDIPACDVVIIGGSGSRLSEIFGVLRNILKPGGRLVINAITPETIYEVLDYLKNCECYEYSAVQLQVSRYESVGNYHLPKAMNPVSVISCIKTE